MDIPPPNTSNTPNPSDAATHALLECLGRALEYKENAQGCHAQLTSRIAALLARGLGWDEARVQQLASAALLHDLGKITIPDSILLKPGRLSPSEWAVMQSHCQQGADFLQHEQPSPLLALTREVALYHHERWDGTGYPTGLAGNDIPQSARIVAVADVFDTLLAPRPYKVPWPAALAAGAIRDGSGKQFDPEVVEQFVRLLPEILTLCEQFQLPASDPLQFR